MFSSASLKINIERRVNVFFYLVQPFLSNSCRLYTSFSTLNCCSIFQDFLWNNNNFFEFAILFSWIWIFFTSIKYFLRRHLVTFLGVILGPSQHLGPIDWFSRIGFYWIQNYQRYWEVCSIYLKPKLLNYERIFPYFLRAQTMQTTFWKC